MLAGASIGLLFNNFVVYQMLNLINFTIGSALGFISGAIANSLFILPIRILIGAVPGALAGAPVGALAGALIGGLVGAPVGTLAGALIGALVGTAAGFVLSQLLGGSSDTADPTSEPAESVPETQEAE